MFVAACVLTVGICAEAKVITEPVEYRHGDVVLQGLLAYDDAKSGRLPAVLIVHEWWGCNAYAQKRAADVAALGYVAFALDMYGKGVTTTDREEAARLAGQFYTDPALMRARAAAGLDVLRKHERVDASRIAAIGYCFGGTTVLQMAVGGAELRGVVSFHGGLFAIPESDKGPVKAKLLVLHGADDPFISDADLGAFVGGLRRLKADWQMMHYGNAVHAFTNPAATGEIPGAKYDAATERRSWEHMQVFLKECLAGA
ncbi:MAG: dienelactone hydrolase family protein [Phycisphaerales bacterium]|nr:dienelactone hydrolase family protein [Phycisphaerales bacterium]